jgi:hypothetical protein
MTDEWFYAVEGEFIIEIGQERITLNPGDSVMAPRKIPHVWAYIGETKGRMLIAFMPATETLSFTWEVLSLGQCGGGCSSIQPAGSRIGIHMSLVADNGMPRGWR